MPRAPGLLRLTNLRSTVLRTRLLRLPPNLPLPAPTLPGLLLPAPHRTSGLLPRLLLLPRLPMPTLNRLALAWLRLPGPCRTCLSLPRLGPARLCLRLAWLLAGVLRTCLWASVLWARWLRALLLWLLGTRLLLLLCSPQLGAGLLGTLLGPRTRLRPSVLRSRLRAWLLLWSGLQRRLRLLTCLRPLVLRT
ncbi:hypothetical protein [Kribbella kalugense]|uniref:Uncharacterized protein n=1 Tax=Kribbella kalugense TaxID=2512221 RepID=A0A4R7ZYX2_9ACTN|nr:hypothetical protein [Kribbella kalugense]TDW23403.1 hypothetical protein EV650_2256 [Kribbella kalugense]